MEHRVAVSSKGGKKLVKRHDLNGWTLIDEKTFYSGDVSAMAEHCGVDEDHMKSVLANTSDQMMHVNKHQTQLVDDDEEDHSHHVVHGEYIGHDGGDRARADDSEHGVA